MRSRSDSDPMVINSAHYAGAIAISAILALVAIRILMERG